MSTSTTPEVRHEDLEQPGIDPAKLRRSLIWTVLVLAAVIAVVTLVPGLASLREQFAHAQAGWLLAGAGLKILSGVCFVVVFREVFCPTMSRRLSAEIGFAELGANAVVPTGGAGGIALGVWALRRSGMDVERIARRSVAFFFLTSVPNVVGVIIVGAGLGLGILPGRASPALTIGPASLAAAAVLGVIAGGRWAGRMAERARQRRGPSSRVAQGLAVVSAGIEESIVLLRRHDARLLAGLVGYLAFDVMVLWATFQSVGASPPLAIIWLGYLIGELGGLIPLPGGIGGVDLGLVGMLVLYHVPLAPATAAVLLYRGIVLLVPAVIGAVAFVMLRRDLSGERERIAACAPGAEIEVIGRGRVRIGP